MNHTAQGKLPLYHQINAAAEQQHRRQTYQCCGKASENLRDLFKAGILFVDIRLIDRPSPETGVFRPRSLNGLDHADACHRGGHELASVAFHHPQNIDSPSGNIPGEEKIYRHHQKSDGGQKQTVPDRRKRICTRPKKAGCLPT